MIGGDGKEAEIDAGYFGGYVKPANYKADRRDRRFPENQSGKRKAVIVIRERGGNTLPAVFPSESHALSFIRSRIAKGTIVHADESGNWNDLHARFRAGGGDPQPDTAGRSGNEGHLARQLFHALSDRL